MGMDEIRKVEGVGPQQIGGGRGSMVFGRGPMLSVVTACLASACLLVGALPVEASGRQERVQRYVTARPVVTKRRHVELQPVTYETYEPVRYETYEPIEYETYDVSYEPCPEKVVKRYNYYVAPRVVVEREPVIVCSLRTPVGLPAPSTRWRDRALGHASSPSSASIMLVYDISASLS